jgi:hypothetical protein
MTEENRKPKLVHDEATPEAPFNPAEYFRKALALRRPLQPVIKKVTVLAEVHVGRPHPDTWFQLNPSPEASVEAYVIKDKDKNVYYIDDAMLGHPILAPRLKPATLIEAATWPPEKPYIIPFFHPDPDRDIPAYNSAWVAYEQAIGGTWTQMRWGAGTFEVAQALNNKNPPTFSGKPMWELLAVGFGSRMIMDENHPYVQAVSGVVV